MHSIHKTQGRQGSPYNGLFGEAPPKRSTLFRLQVYRFKRVEFSQVEVYERVGKPGNA